MAVTRAWADLHAKRFPELLLDCGNRIDPGIIYSEDLRDWSDKATTPDQHRIEKYIDRFDLRTKRILHVGVGNSGLAKRFRGRVGAIVGTTIDQPEIAVARSLNLPGYTAVVHNKYSSRHDIVPGTFDFIVDNNPTSPCCCVRHLADLFAFYREKLSDDGQLVTDALGLGWVPDDSNPRWSFDFEDLAAVAPLAGFTANRMTRSVYVLSRIPPQPPKFQSILRYRLRRARMLPARILLAGPPRIAQISRQVAKRVLLATVPWALPARYRRGK